MKFCKLHNLGECIIYMELTITNLIFIFERDNCQKIYIFEIMQYIKAKIPTNFTSFYLFLPGIACPPFNLILILA